MGAYKKLNQQDAYITTYTARKSWSASGSQYPDLGILNLVGESGSGAYIPQESNIVYGGGDSNASTASFDKRLVYQSVYQLYYSNFSGSITSTTSSYFDNYLQSSFNVSGSRHIDENIAVFSLPKEVYGTHLEPSSISMTLDVPPGSERNYVINNYVTSGGIDSDLDLYNQYTIPAISTLPSSSTSIVDDGEGNLYLSSGSNVLLEKVGNVIYPHGQIIITDTPLAKVFNDELNAVIEWKSNLPIYTQNYHCKVKANDLNFTLNKTAVNQETGQIKDNITGSAFQPYVSTIGLYNDANQLIAVAKTASPVPKSTNTDMSFHIKLDMNFGVDRFKQKIPLPPPSPLPFIFEVIIANDGDSFVLPLESTSNIDVSVDWGDGSVSTITGYDTGNSHTFTTAGTYTVEMSGVIDGWNYYVNSVTGEDPTQIGDISQWGTFEINTDSTFDSCSNLTVSATDTLKISAITSGATYMFYACTSLGAIDASNWDLSEATQLDQMFQNSGLTSINLWDMATAPNLTSVKGMFQSCDGITSVDLSPWNTTNNIENMQGMFLSCDNLTTVNFSGLDMSSVTNMRFMFQSCPLLTGNLDLSGLTGTVNTFGMFYLDASLTSVDISGGVSLTNVQGMFNGCTNLQTVDFTGCDTSAVTDTYTMFQDCNSLTTVTGNEDFRFTGITSIGTSYMFRNCYVLDGLDTSLWAMSTSVEQTTQMFYNCYALTTIDMSSWATMPLTNMSYMFGSCRSLTSLDVSSLDTSSVTDMTAVFYDLRSITSGITNLNSLDVSSVTDATFMMGGAVGGPTGGGIDYDLSSWRFTSLVIAKEIFKNNRLISSLDVSDWGMGNVTNMDSTFETLDYCTAITGLETWNVSNVTNFTQAFINHKVNSGINISGWNMSSATNVTQMLYDCDQFDENLAAWDINQVTTGFDTFMAQASGLSTANYDATLIGWAAQIPLAYNGTINFGGSEYTLGGAAATAHANLVADVGAISDGGGV